MIVKAKTSARREEEAMTRQTTPRYLTRVVTALAILGIAGTTIHATETTPAGTENLLQLAANGTMTNASIGGVAGLDIFLLNSPTESANDLTGAPLTAANVDSVLMGLVGSGSLASPLIFGFELNDRTITSGVSFSSVLGVDDGAAGGGSTVPEPASLPLFAVGVILILAGGFRKKNQADTAE